MALKVGDRVKHEKHGIGTITEVMKSWKQMEKGQLVTKRKIVYCVKFDGLNSNYAIAQSAKTLKAVKQ